MSDQFKISLPDGSVREMPAGSSPADVAAAIGPGLAKAALAGRVGTGADAKVVDTSHLMEHDTALAIIIRCILAHHCCCT